MAYTGGLLNELNGKMGISAPYKSVPVMKLIKVHNPKSKDELVELIKWHSENECECGIVSKGTVESFGNNLFKSQQNYWGEIRFTLKECIQWEYDLFVVQSLKGSIVENNIIKELTQLYPDLTFEEAIGFLDEELRIDIIIRKKDLLIAGIQVKPNTFLKMRREVITFNKNANLKWDHPVFYLFYDESEKIINLDEFNCSLQEILTK